MKKNNTTAIGGDSPTNGGSSTIQASEPYSVSVTITGVCPLLFHRWDTEGVDAKSKAAKGSAAKKYDDLESYIYRHPENGNLAIPTVYLVGSILGAAKFRQDPRSPRKSAVDLFKAGIIPIEEFSDLGIKKWDYEDKRRALIQRNAINRIRPALKAGWKSTFILQVNLPEYISESDLNEVIAAAGRLIGIADFRPTFGRFQVVGFKRI